MLGMGCGVWFMGVAYRAYSTRFVGFDWEGRAMEVVEGLALVSFMGSRGCGSGLESAVVETVRQKGRE